MIDLQQAFVADHIASLERDGAALRAERERDHVRAHAAAGTDVTDEPIDHPTALESRRARVGRWLVGLGEAIAGPSDPCRDDNDRMPHAA